MEVLEAYCNTMLGGLSDNATDSASDSSANNVALKNHNPVVRQLEQVRQSLWPSEIAAGDRSATASPRQASLPHQSKRKYNRKKRPKNINSDLPIGNATQGEGNSALALEDSDYAERSANNALEFQSGKKSIYRQHVTAFICNKGGTGKTTSCVNIAGWLAKLGKRVLVIDLDAQASASTALGIKSTQHTNASADLFNSGLSIEDCTLATDWGVDIVPASVQLILAERELTINPTSADYLRQKIDALNVRYDHILLDAPAGHSAVSINALVASDNILMPIDTSAFTEEAYKLLLEIIKQAQRFSKKRLDLSGVLLKQTAGNYLERLSRSDLQRASEALEENGFLNTPIYNIPYSAACERAARQAMMLAEYAPADALTRSFKKVAKKIIDLRLAADDCATLRDHQNFSSINFQKSFPKAELAF